ncbi:MAG: hypothetical protein ACXQTI_10550, partial [Candidatus Nezhaarchaeales archaeon]
MALMLLMRAFMRRSEFRLVFVVVSLFSALLSSAWSVSNFMYGEVAFVAGYVGGGGRYLVVNGSDGCGSLSLMV